jgi:hypothetical protein
VKEKGREDKNPEKKDFLRPEGRLVLVLLLIRAMSMMRLNLNKSVTPLGAHSSKTQSTNLLPQSILLVLHVYAVCPRPLHRSNLNT